MILTTFGKFNYGGFAEAIVYAAWLVLGLSIPPRGMSVPFSETAIVVSGAPTDMALTTALPSRQTAGDIPLQMSTAAMNW